MRASGASEWSWRFVGVIWDIAQACCMTGVSIKKGIHQHQYWISRLITGNPGHTCNNAPALAKFLPYLYSILIQNSTGTELRGHIWAADTCQYCWTLKEAMSHHTEHDSENDESSHHDMEYHSESGSIKSDEGSYASTESEEDMFLSIWYPSLPPSKKFPLWFHKPYLHNWDFKDSNQALRYITKYLYFNLESIHQSLQSFPDLSWDFIYSNTYVETHWFTQLQHFINESIQFQTGWLYNTLYNPNPK